MRAEKVILSLNYDQEIGNFYGAKTHPSYRGNLCYFKCTKCNSDNNTKIPLYGMVHRFIHCESCNCKLIVLSLKEGYGRDSIDLIFVSNTVKRVWLENTQPEDGFIDPTDLPEYDSMLNQYGSSQPVYFQLVNKIALTRNKAILSMFKSTSRDEILKLW